MSAQNKPKAYTIVHKDTNQVISLPSKKKLWEKPAHAKNAWAGLDLWDQTAMQNRCVEYGVKPVIDNRYSRLRFPKFNEQSTWVLKPLMEEGLVIQTEQTLTVSFFNGLTPVQHEIITKIYEECAESIQICGKIHLHGLKSSNPFITGAETNKVLLEKELGDVLAFILLAEKEGLVSLREIEKQATNKINKIAAHTHYLPIYDVVDVSVHSTINVKK